MKHTLERLLQLLLILVVHGDADSHARVLVADAAPGPDLRQEACAFDLSEFGVRTITSWPDLLVECRVGQDHGLVGDVSGWLPLLLHDERECFGGDGNLAAEGLRSRISVLLRN